MTRINFSREHLIMLDNALRIAEKDGSIYGAAEEGSKEEGAISERIEKLHQRLQWAIRRST
jgi:hypothetical protein